MGRGSRQVALIADQGVLRIDNLGRGPTDFAYRLVRGQPEVTTRNLTGTVLVNGVDRGAEATTVVPASAVEIRNRTSAGQLRLPVRLGYSPISR